MNISPHIKSLRHFVERQDYAGYDPYDGLNSPVARTLSFNRKYGRIAWIQLLRRLPINLRPLLLIAKGQNPKGLGLFLGSYTKLYRAEQRPEYLERIQYLLGLLDGCKSQGYSGACWGYNFDWQNAKMFVPKGTPTIVNSSFVGHALLDCWQSTGQESALDLAFTISEFLNKDLNRKSEGANFCFSYTPLDNNYVHNANLLGASLLLRMSKINGKVSLKETAMNSLRYSMKYQNDDGSWYYAEADGQRWIDSFHTGFNLQAIRYFLEYGEGEEYKDQYQKGVRFYAENFFLQDGTPKHYHNCTFPIDIHAPAQAIFFFSREGDEYRELTDRILNWTLDNMYGPRGFFYFRKGRWTTNKIPYMRWSQAWAFHALTEYYLQREGQQN